MEDEWKDIEESGKKAYVIKENLKRLRDILKQQNKEVCGWINLKMDESIKQFNEMNLLLVDMIKMQMLNLWRRRVRLTLCGATYIEGEVYCYKNQGINGQLKGTSTQDMVIMF